jgi:hypothetical protein
MTCVKKRAIFLGDGCLPFGRGELGWERRRRNREGEGRPSGYLLALTGGNTDGLIMSVILSVIPSISLTVNWSRHCTEISF